VHPVLAETEQKQAVLPSVPTWQTWPAMHPVLAASIVHAPFVGPPPPLPQPGTAKSASSASAAQLRRTPQKLGKDRRLMIITPSPSAPGQ
jgi:hypothetical protein